MSNSASPPSTARRAYLALRKRLRRHAALWLPALLTVLGLVTIIIGAWLARLTRDKDKWLDALWLEVSKAGIQVVAVGVLGGALTAVWQNIRGCRERQIERNDKIRAELVSLFALYKDVKAVRRTLRSLGLDLKTYPNNEREQVLNAVHTEEQARGFHAQMLILSGLQLGFETKGKQFSETDFLDEDTGKAVEALGCIEDHLSEVLDLWEQNGRTIREGTALAVVYDELEKLFRVRQYLRPQVSDQMRKITMLINEHVFGGASKATQDIAAKIDSARVAREDRTALTRGQ